MVMAQQDGGQSPGDPPPNTGGGQTGGSPIPNDPDPPPTGGTPGKGIGGGYGGGYYANSPQKGKGPVNNPHAAGAASKRCTTPPGKGWRAGEGDCFLYERR